MNKLNLLLKARRVLNPGSWIVLAMISACEVEPQSPLEPASQAIDLAEVSEGIEVRHLPPTEFGGAWARVFVLPGSESLVSFERQMEGQDEWEALGFTNDEGMVKDFNVPSTRQARYRMGGQIITKWFAALRDLDLEGRYCPEAPISATRVRVAKDKFLVTGSCSLSIQAEEFILDGTIKSFDQRGSGENAGILQIVAKRVLGPGQLLWVGQPGGDGAPGAPGAPGKKGRSERGYADGGNGGIGLPGSNGLSGGAGGVVRIVYEEFINRPDQIVIDGGVGGLGGTGGPGGPGGVGVPYENCRGFRTREGPEVDCTTEYGKDGRPGPIGPRGANGSAGSSGRVEMIRETFQENTR